MSVAELAERLRRILDDYEARGREPQRALEMVACFSSCAFLGRQEFRLLGILNTW